MKKTTKSLIAAVAAITLCAANIPMASLSPVFTCSSITASAAEEGQCGDNAYYTIDDNGVLRINGTNGKINRGAFQRKTEIKSVIIEDGITSIGYEAFYGCTALKTITIPEGVTEIGDSAFALCKSLETITIPEGVTEIGNYAFARCVSLETITIPEGVTSIGVQAFYACTSLKTITIPKSVTKINQSMFSGCTSLKTVTIPESVTSIGYNTFYYCSSVEKIYCYANPSNLNWLMLAYELKPEKGTICYVPAKYYEAYINKFGNINVTFRIMPISIEQTLTLGSDVQTIDLNESVSNAEGVVFSVTEGSELPAGLTLENGVISGTPEALGDFTTTFDISKNDTVIGTADVKIHVEGDFSAEITGTYNEGLEEELKNFVSGDEDVTFALAEGSELPAGLTLENGSITGVPEAAGEFTTTLDLSKNGSSVGTLELTFKIDKAMPEITVNLTNTSITIGDVLTEEDFEVVCDIPGSITWENSGQPLTEGENVIVWNYVPEDENYAETTGTIVLNIAAPEGNNDPSALTLIDIQYIFAYDLGFFNYEHTYSFTVEVTPGSDNGNGQISTNYSNNTSVNGNNCSQNGSITSIIPNCVNHLHSTISRLFSIFH